MKIAYLIAGLFLVVGSLFIGLHPTLSLGSNGFSNPVVNNGGGSITTPVSIVNGGTATSTGGVTNGVEYYNGTNITNSANFTFNGSIVGIGAGGTTWYTGLDGSNNYGVAATQSGGVLTAPFVTVAGSGFVGINNSSPAQFLDVGGNVNINNASSYMQNSGTILFASSTQATTFLGFNAGQSILTYGTTTASVGHGSYSTTAIGFNALQNASSTSSFQNTAVGSAALQGTGSNPTFQQDTGVGSQVMHVLTSGSFNSGFGVNSLAQVSSGGSNAAFGEQSGQQLTSGSSDVYMGTAAGEWNATGSGNTALGASALVGNGAVNNNSDNTAIGFQAGSGLTTGSNNIVLGYNSATTTQLGNNNITIGFDISGMQAATNGSNMLDIGNLLFGTGLTSQSSSSPAGSFAIGSSTFPLVQMTLGTNGSTNGTSTTAAGKLQWDGYNSAGARMCAYFNSANALVSQAGACNF